MLPNFIGIGAPKSATTFLFKCLSEHPEIFMSPVKETQYFIHDTDLIDLKEYEKYFITNNNFKIIGEYSTIYLESEIAPYSIKKHLPNVKLLVSLRNPIDQVYSNYWHLLKQNFSSSDPNYYSLEEALENYYDRLIEPAFYYKHINNWLKYFDKEKLKIIFYDDIKLDPSLVMNEIYSFLEVTNEFIPDSLNIKDSSVRIGKSPKNKISNSIYSNLYIFLNKYIYHPSKSILGLNNAMMLKEKLKIRQILEFIFMKNGYPTINKDMKSRLINIYLDDIINLENLTKKDLSSWKV